MNLHHDSTIVNDLDRPVDLTGHILSPFYQRELMYQDCKFQSISPFAMLPIRYHQ